MNLFISGPITGMPNGNREAFDSAKLALEAVGYTVTLPQDYVAPGATWQQAMRKSIAAMCLKADGVAFLDGYNGSKGSAIEKCLAYDLQIPIRTVKEWIDKA